MQISTSRHHCEDNVFLWSYTGNTIVSLALTKILLFTDSIGKYVLHQQKLEKSDAESFSVQRSYFLALVSSINLRFPHLKLLEFLAFVSLCDRRTSSIMSSWLSTKQTRDDIHLQNHALYNTVFFIEYQVMTRFIISNVIMLNN